MATTKQRQAAKRNVKKARRRAGEAVDRQHAGEDTSRRSGSRVPRSRSASGPVARRRRRARNSYDEARRRNIAGRSKMGRAELARALGGS